MMWKGLHIPILRRVRQRVGHAARSRHKSSLGYDLVGWRQLEVGDSPRSVSRTHLAKYGQFRVIEKRPDRRGRILFLLDLSASQSLGTDRTKGQVALEAVLHLGIACLARGHAAACIAFTDRIEYETGFTAAMGRWQSELADVAALRPRRPRTNPVAALERAWLLCSGPLGADQVFLVSDFLFEPPRRRLDELHDLVDLVALPVTDPFEERSDAFFGLFVFRDVESGETVLASGVAEQDPSRYLDRMGIPRCPLRTDESEYQQFIRLKDFFQGRLENDERRV